MGGVKRFVGKREKMCSSIEVEGEKVVKTRTISGSSGG